MDTHLVMAIVMAALGGTLVGVGVWAILAAVQDPELLGVNRARHARQALGRAAERSRR